jgi:hypothetical protein
MFLTYLLCYLRAFLMYILPYALDKHHDVRRSAGAAVQVIDKLDHNMLISVLVETPPAKQVDIASLALNISCRHFKPLGQLLLLVNATNFRTCHLL